VARAEEIGDLREPVARLAEIFGREFLQANRTTEAKPAPPVEPEAVAPPKPREDLPPTPDLEAGTPGLAPLPDYPPPGAQPGEGMRVTPREATATRPVNVFSGPGTLFEVLGGLPDGSRIRLLEERSGWYRIEAEGFPFGWVPGNFVRLTPEKKD
jgi:uncharacterized protein YgiM (DUF1202 family)